MVSHACSELDSHVWFHLALLLTLLLFITLINDDGDYSGLFSYEIRAGAKLITNKSHAVVLFLKGQSSRIFAPNETAQAA